MHTTADAAGRSILLARLAPLADQTLLALLGLALSLRVLAIIAFPSLHHPDENFQLFEQAHRIAFGYGIVPWEFHEGIRSPVLPYVLAGLFWFGDRLFGGPEGYLLLARLALAVSSLAGVAAVYRMGARTSRTHGLIAGLVAATWFELVYFAARPLTEAVATTCLLVALSLVSGPDVKLGFRRLVSVGFCLSLALMLRIHLAPGLLAAAIFVGRRELSARWLPMLLGGLGPVLLFAVADWLYWGAPLHSYLQAIRVDLIEGKASRFGVDPPWFYFGQLAGVWAGALPAMGALIILRWRASALWILVAVAIIAVHMAIPHKEYRFVFPAFACLAIVAAMGSADLILRLRAVMVHAKETGRALVALAAGLWVATSAALAAAPGFSDEWFEARDLIEASFKLAHMPDLCGVLFYDDAWASTGGYAHLHRNVPLYALEKDQETAQQSTAAFNAIVLARESLDDFQQNYALQGCSGEEEDSVCVMTREGSCTPEPDLEVNAMLVRIGE
jgi:phosphatidylinositol glycan class B